MGVVAYGYRVGRSCIWLCGFVFCRFRRFRAVFAQVCGLGSFWLLGEFLGVIRGFGFLGVLVVRVA